MRLLRIEDDGEYSLVEVFGQNIPPYIVLSHTWGPDDEEVSYKNMVKGKGKSKAGFKKIQFCAARAAEDGLRHFWVDTCCIDKSSSAELSEAINSMFRWYRDAVKCVVYLADVSTEAVISQDSTGAIQLFEQSRWFTRGWTLQELLAPRIVEFFSADGLLLGKKDSLMQEIHEATGISLQALRGDPLAHFSVDERMSWASNRSTKREEDAAYSLLGLFDLHMPLIYGEGREKAFVRLKREIRNASVENMTTRTEDTNDIRAIVAPPAETPQQLDMTEQNLKADKKDAGDISQEEMKVWWDSCMEKYMGQSAGYRKVAVFLMKWHDALDELQTRDEVEELNAVFRGRFHFYTEIVELNVSSKPQHQIDRHLTAFIERHDGPDNLLIVYYAGQGVYYHDHQRLELSASADWRSSGGFKNARANWNRTEEILRSDEVEGDILTILDVAYSPNPQMSGKEGSGSILPRDRTEDTRIFELLTACAVDQVKAVPGEKSFTRALIDALTELAKESDGLSFTTFHLNQRILLHQGRRSKTASQLWSMLPHRPRHIRLEPWKKNKNREDLAAFPPPRPRGYLTLRFGLRDASLNQVQIEYMTSNLAKAFNDKSLVGIHRIDWGGMERAESARHDRLTLATIAIARWKRLVQKGWQERKPLVTGKEEDRREGEGSKIPSPTRKRVRYWDDLDEQNNWQAPPPPET